LNKILVLTALSVALTGLCPGASVCVSGSLSSYLALGSDGCTIGPDTLFDFRVLPGTTGASEIAPTAALLAPSGGAPNVNLTTSVNVTSASGSIQELLFTYKLSGESYIASAISLSNSSESGDGAVTGLQNFCADGIFGTNGVSGCTGRAGSLAAVDGVQNSDSKSFAAAALLSVTNDLTIDGGLRGSARGASLANQFTTVSSAVPEPMPVLLTGIGLALATLRLVQSKRKDLHNK